ncbi:MAG: hypothetical protein U0M72_01305 [Eggerthellaceae bacterium]
MDKRENEQSPRTYRLKPVYKPLAKKDSSLESEDPSPSNGCLATEPTPDPTPRTSLLRAANEDDDLYDPYSDYHDGTLKALEFEQDPWR